MDAPRIAPRDVFERMCRGERICFVDARAEEDWCRAEHKLPAAVRLPPQDVDELASDVSRGTPVVAYCSSAGEQVSALVARRLIQLGYAEVYALEGGFVAWQRGGDPLEQASGVSPIPLSPP